MSDHTDVINKNKAWWLAHPDFKKPIATADSLARSLVHWHHNVEAGWRHYGHPVASDEFFMRQYAIGATQAWLAESQSELDTLGPSTPDTWYLKRDLEVLIRLLQVALDNFEHNTRYPYGTP